MTEEQSKQPATIVGRTFYVNEKHESGDLNICVTYKYNRVTRVITYGAAVFRYEDNKPYEVYCKRNLRHTAEQRLKKRPVIVGEFEDSSTLEEFHANIRKLMFKHGVRGPRI